MVPASNSNHSISRTAAVSSPQVTTSDGQQQDAPPSLDKIGRFSSSSHVDKVQIMGGDGKIHRRISISLRRPSQGSMIKDGTEKILFHDQQVAVMNFLIRYFQWTVPLCFCLHWSMKRPLQLILNMGVLPFCLNVEVQLITVMVNQVNNPICALIKDWAKIPRPIWTKREAVDVTHVISRSYSFPSGHTCGVSNFGLLYMLYYGCTTPTVITWILCTLIMATSRVALSVHWLQDVIAGCMISGVTVPPQFYLYRFLLRESGLVDTPVGLWALLTVHTALCSILPLVSYITNRKKAQTVYGLSQNAFKPSTVPARLVSLVTHWAWFSGLTVLWSTDRIAFKTLPRGGEWFTLGGCVALAFLYVVRAVYEFLIEFESVNKFLKLQPYHSEYRLKALGYSVSGFVLGWWPWLMLSVQEKSCATSRET